jgi:7-keto-8-aminopelargonate synthetase-like enzyme
VGVIGPNGRGLAAAENLSDDLHVQMGTLSKALGVSGGYICGSRSLIEWLINRARSFIYSTAPPAALAAAACAAVEFLASAEGEERRVLLCERIKLLEQVLPTDSGTATRSNKAVRHHSSAIFPWLVGNEQSAVDLALALRHEGFFVPAIRYPTVAKGSARLRITVTTAHTEDQIRSLGEALARLRT